MALTPRVYDPTTTYCIILYVAGQRYRHLRQFTSLDEAKAEAATMRANGYVAYAEPCYVPEEVR